MEDKIYSEYCAILAEELQPAMGCTEPIAVAYCAALARKTLGCLPEDVQVYASANIIKNVKSVVVPNTGGQRGLTAAAAAGIVAGDADAQLQVLAGITPEQVEQIAAYEKQGIVHVHPSDKDFIFDIQVRVSGGGHTAFAEIAGFHTNIIRLEQDGDVLLDRPYTEEGPKHATDRSLLTVERIVEFADAVKIADVQSVLQRQIDCNTAIAREGLQGQWGANLGRILLESYGDSTHNRAMAWAAAGSDARMNGCELPVVINSGSGNQGITVSVPLIVYARELGSSDEQLYRALVLSNLVAIHQKTGIGRLSAFCGAVCAGAAAGAGIAYLDGGGYKEACHAVVNALSIVAGMVCDGAKPSCAGKIAFSVNAGILGYVMYRDGQQFYGGDGIVKKGVENTIDSIARLGRDGMRATNDEIIRIMLGS